ncbi:MAG: nicotinate (nicotinamide) nucleotide adenylyltransferase [Clostridiales bacterium]|nr:nicotinate (nicotinamide) nucleotide adenylyltransferase [Clostridiales bacterium]
MRIAIFGGSFDPIHIEHIRLVEAAIKSLHLDKLIVMPAYSPPHKPWRVLADATYRLEMCRLAFVNQPKVEISDFEIMQGGTSYTYLTCEHFKKEYPKAEIFWLVGTDMLRDFPTWKEPQKILENVTLAVCGRNEKEGWLAPERKFFHEKFGKDLAEIHYNGADVSSTKIRVLAGAGTDLTHFTPISVAEYIQKNGLYKIENAKEALGLEKTQRMMHSIRVANLAAARANGLKISEQKAITAALFHDCAKNLPEDSPYLQDFTLQKEWGEVPLPVIHQYQGAYVAKKYFSVTDEDILNAIRFHTSARPNMSELEKLIFLADMLEEERSYDGVEILRKLFWDKSGLDLCMEEALRQTLEFLETKGGEVYPLTRQAYDFYAAKNKE